MRSTVVAVLLAASHAQAAVPVHIVEQDKHMSRVVPVSLDAGKTWTPVWAGVKSGFTGGRPYNFFCNEVRMPSKFGTTHRYDVGHAVSPFTRSLVSRAHDLGQINPDAAAALQLVLWDIAEDGFPDLDSGNFRARPTLRIRAWADLFQAQAKKQELTGSRVTLLRNPDTQDVLVMDYDGVPGVPPIVPPAPGIGGYAGDPGYYMTYNVPEPSTAALLGLALVSLTLRRSSK